MAEMKGFLAFWTFTLCVFFRLSEVPSTRGETPKVLTPIATLQAILQQIDTNSVTLSTNSDGTILCQVLCTNSEDRVHVRDAFMSAFGTCKSTLKPPTVNVVVPLNWARSIPSEQRPEPEIQTTDGKLICLRCGYSWHPRVADPKECPRCKSRLWDSPPNATEAPRIHIDQQDHLASLLMHTENIAGGVVTVEVEFDVLEMVDLGPVGSFPPQTLLRPGSRFWVYQNGERVVCDFDPDSYNWSPSDNLLTGEMKKVLRMFVRGQKLSLTGKILSPFFGEQEGHFLVSKIERR